MSVLEFISSLVIALVAVLLLRPTIAQALSSGQLTKAKVGPVEVEWDRTLSEVRQELADAPKPLERVTESTLTSSELELAGLLTELRPLVDRPHRSDPRDLPAGAGVRPRCGP